MAETIQVEGLKELQRALGRVDKDSGKVVRKELKAVAEPVRQRAESLASTQIRNIGPVWSRMKVLQPAGAVEVRPATRNRGGSPRPGFGALLMDRAMVPALGESEAEIMSGLELVMDHLFEREGF